MNEEFEEGGKTSATYKRFRKWKLMAAFHTVEGSSVAKATLQTSIDSCTQTDFLSFFLFLAVFFKTCLLNITWFYFFITNTTIVKVIEEFLFSGCCNFHHSFARLCKGDVLLLSLGAQGIWLHSCDKEFIKRNLCGALWNQLINCSPQ